MPQSRNEALFYRDVHQLRAALERVSQLTEYFGLLNLRRTFDEELPEPLKARAEQLEKLLWGAR